MFLYNLKVNLLGYPRIMRTIGKSETGRFELMEDIITGEKFIGPREHISAGIGPGKTYIKYYEGANKVYNFDIQEKN